MKRALVAGTVAISLAVGILIGASIRPARADQASDIHRIAIAVEDMNRHLDQIASRMNK